MDIILSNTSEEPIYQQIISQIKAQIISGKLAAGDALPSMRLLATQLRISVITTKRAYEELERDGYIETIASKGCYVKRQNSDFPREEVIQQTEDLLAKACQKGKMCELSLEVCINLILLSIRVPFHVRFGSAMSFPVQAAGFTIIISGIIIYALFGNISFFFEDFGGKSPLIMLMGIRSCKASGSSPPHVPYVGNFYERGILW